MTIEQRLNRLEEKVSQKKPLKEDGSSILTEFQYKLETLLLRTKGLTDAAIPRREIEAFEETLKEIYIGTWNSQVYKHSNEID